MQELLFLLSNIFGRIVSWHHIDEGQSGSFFFLRRRKWNPAHSYRLIHINIRRWVFSPEYCLEKLFFWHFWQSFLCSILFLHCILSCCVSSSSDSSRSNCWTSHIPLWRTISVFVSGEQMDSAPSHLYYFLGCDTSVPQAMGTKRVLLQPPSPPVRWSGQHLLHLQPTAAWIFCP